MLQKNNNRFLITKQHVEQKDQSLETILPSPSFWALGPCSKVQSPQSFQSHFLILLVHPVDTWTNILNMFQHSEH